jgi:hypothetical protein
MMILKGDVGKSVVVDRLSKYTDTQIFGYSDDIPTYIDGITYVLRKDVSIELFCNYFEENLLKNEYTEMLIIYTNLNEDEVGMICNRINMLEENGCVGYSIVTCK